MMIIDLYGNTVMKLTSCSAIKYNQSPLIWTLRGREDCLYYGGVYVVIVC